MTNQNCHILDEAIKRYTKIISSSLHTQRRRSEKRSDRPRLIEIPSGRWSNDPLFEGFLNAVSIDLKQPCEEAPGPDMKEECKNMIIFFL